MQVFGQKIKKYYTQASINLLDVLSRKQHTSIFKQKCDKVIFLYNPSRVSDREMPKSKSLEQRYPNLHRFVEKIGSIEMGQHEMISAFVRAYDLGGTVYEGEDHYSSLEAALEDLEAGIQAYLDEHGI